MKKVNRHCFLFLPKLLFKRVQVPNSQKKFTLAQNLKAGVAWTGHQTLVRCTDLLWLPWLCIAYTRWVTRQMIALQPLQSTADPSWKVPVHTKETEKACNINAFKNPKSQKCRLWRTLSFLCVCLSSTCYNRICEIAEFQIVALITDTKSTFLVARICLFHLAPGELWRPSCIASGSQAYRIWGPSCEYQVVTMWWMSKSNVQETGETGS